MGRYLGWDAVASWTAANTDDFTYFLLSGLRRFYYPVVEGKMYEWSFLRQAGTIASVASTADYTLPDDFSGVMVDNSVTFASGSDIRRLVKADEAEIRALQATETSTGSPRYWTLKAAAHAPATGHRWTITLYPTPTASATLHYRYVIAPNTITSANKYPLGGAIHSDTILEAVLAAAEDHIDDEAGLHAAKFSQLLQMSMRVDQQNINAPRTW